MSQSRPLQRINSERGKRIRGELALRMERDQKLYRAGGMPKPLEPKASIISTKDFTEDTVLLSFLNGPASTLRSERSESRGSESSGNGEWRERDT